MIEREGENDRDRARVQVQVRVRVRVRVRVGVRVSSRFSLPCQPKLENFIPTHSASSHCS